MRRQRVVARAIAFGQRRTAGAGLHLMVGDNVQIDGTHGRKRCLACRRASSAYAPLMSAEVATTGQCDQAVAAIGRAELAPGARVPTEIVGDAPSRCATVV